VVDLVSLEEWVQHTIIPLVEARAVLAGIFVPSQPDPSGKGLGRPAGASQSEGIVPRSDKGSTG
jgi:hypothetical protein